MPKWVLDYFDLITKMVIQKKTGESETDEMTYPINEQEFMKKWLCDSDNSDDGVQELGVAVVRSINKAYIAGLDNGRAEAAYWQQARSKQLGSCEIATESRGELCRK